MVIRNTGPLIALAKADQLVLLEGLFGHVLIPPAVHRELLAKSGPESARLDEALHGLIEVTPSPPLAPELKIVTSGLGAGEQQVIALAHEREASLVIIDERLARRRPASGSDSHRAGGRTGACQHRTKIKAQRQVDLRGKSLGGDNRPRLWPGRASLSVARGRGLSRGEATHLSAWSLPLASA